MHHRVRSEATHPSSLLASPVKSRFPIVIPYSQGGTLLQIYEAEEAFEGVFDYGNHAVPLSATMCVAVNHSRLDLLLDANPGLHQKVLSVFRITIYKHMSVSSLLPKYI